MQPRTAPYMHVYFNATGNTLKIWAMSAGGVVLLYEGVRHLVSLGFQHRLRVKWAAMFVLGVYPNYYGYWNLFK